jgi:hypothetical protein
MTIKTPPATKAYRDNWDRTFARVVQYEERVPCKHIVDGSSPSSGPMYLSDDGRVVCVIKTLDGDITL